MFIKIHKYIKKYPVIGSILVSIVLGFVVSVLYRVAKNRDDMFLNDFVPSSIFLGVFVIYPGILTIINLLSVFVISKNVCVRKRWKRFEYMTVILGSLYSMAYISVSEIIMNADWKTQLYNREVHQPVWSQAMLTVTVLGFAGILGYLLLSFIPLEKMSPLGIVLSMSAMYLGVFECVMWMVQTWNREFWVLSIFPLNCILIVIKVVRNKIHEWNHMEQHERNAYPTNPMLNRFHNFLQKAEYWPVLAFVFMWSLLGVLLCFLLLFGQRPDYIIRSWTETAEWRLSEQTAPPNLFMDEHYLCTVAAGGHAKVVKPIRMGERHGHRVVVNRQLCIANAFEQILEERTPRLHRVIRHIYDTYGFPVAKLIRTKRAADVVYFLMKPLEWFFLMVIYLVDVKPENRIAVQYLPRRME